MTRYLLTTAILFAATPVLAQSPAAPPTLAGPACLRQVNMYDFHLVPGNRSLIVIGRDRQRYRVNFIAECYNIQYKLGLRFKSFGASNLSCIGKGDQVAFNDPAGIGRCIIRDVQYQTPALDQQDAQLAAAAKQR